MRVGGRWFRVMVEVEGSGFVISGLGFRVKVWGRGFLFWIESRVQGLGFRVRVKGLWFRV